MSSQLVVNLIDPNAIVIPDTGGETTPDTGIFSIGEHTSDALSNTNTLIITVASLAIILAIVAVAILLIKRHKKQSKVNGFSSYTSMKLSTKRHLAPRLAGLFALICVTVFGFLTFNNKHMTNNVEALGDDTLTVTTENITTVAIEMDGEAAFGVGESKVTVTTATDKGYTLMAYVDNDNTSLTNTDEESAIEMLETTYSQALADNTWGIALTEPTSQEETIFRGLPTAEKDAMVVKVSGSSATEANDETTLYYGAYVTPDLEYGYYTGVTINYIAVPNVIGDDVTINYHGNGYYFDEAGTKEVNTVTYGQSCEIAYVGGKCRKVYTTEQPYTIVKTSNLNDDGTQNGPYPVGYWDEEADEYVYPLDQKVTIPGADGIRVELKYGLSGNYSSDYIYLANNADWDDYVEIYVPYDSTGEKVYEFDGDMVLVELDAEDEPVEGYDYGVYAEIYPLYNTEPESIETIETTVCNFVKSENLDDEGNKIEPHPYEMYYEDYDEWGDYRNYQTVTIPGAKQIKVVVDYALTAAYVGIREGFPDTYYYGNTEYIEPENWDDGYATVAGTNEYMFNSSTLTFMMTAYEEPIEGYDYGFYARLYPYYDEELEGTTPDITCPITRKTGEYSIPVGADIDYGDTTWYIVYEEDGYLYPYRIYGEKKGIEFIQAYYDLAAGGTFDAYILNYYAVYYSGNDGNGNSRDDWFLPHTNTSTIRSIWYTRSGYTFIGWNTDPNGYGTWYYPGDPIYNLAEPGSSITLYAQWQLN